MNTQSKRKTGDFDSAICGIPGQISVMAYSPARNNCRGHIDTWLPNDPEEFEYEVLDRKGYPATWLQAKITTKNDERIYADFFETMRSNDGY